MEFWYVLFFSIGATTLFTVLTHLWDRFVPKKEEPESLVSGESVPAVEPPKPIPSHIREELDQTPAWWDKQFHNLLDSTGDARVDNDDVEEIAEMTAAGVVCIYYVGPQYALVSCTCSGCRSILTS